MDIISITALIVAVGSIITQIITSTHIKKCHSICCDSDCNKTPPNTPNNERLAINSKI